MKKPFFVVEMLILFAAAFGMISCGESEKRHSAVDRDQEYPVKTEMIKGVKTITNPDFPREGRYRLAFHQELSISDGGSDDIFFGRVFDIRVDDEETIYVSDWKELNIKVFDSRGNFVGIIGRRGEGPHFR